VDRAGKKLLDRALPNDEAKIREIIAELEDAGRVLLVVDQPATIGALPVAVAQAAGVLVGYLPGLAMRRIADLHPGEAKTDARDAFIIAEAARTMPHTLRSVQLADEQLAELSMLCGFDDDLAKQATATSNRIRGLLTQIHPALERVLGPYMDHPAVLDLLRTWPTPEALRHAGRRRIGNRLTKLAPRMGERLADEIIEALGRQTVTVVGTNAATTSVTSTPMIPAAPTVPDSSKASCTVGAAGWGAAETALASGPTRGRRRRMRSRRRCTSRSARR